MISIVTTRAGAARRLSIIRWSPVRSRQAPPLSAGSIAALSAQRRIVGIRSIGRRTANPVSTVRILIVDDHEAVRRGIRSLLASRSEWTVCGEAADGLEAVEKARVLGPDVVLMDVSLPQLDGVEAARTIRRERPETNVVIVSQNDPRLLSRQAAEAGARGFVSKSDLARNLLPIIEKVVDEAQQNSTGGAHGAAERAEQPIDLLAAIVDSSDDAIISKNLDGVITSWNSSAERIFGYTADEAIGRAITLIVPPERRNEEAEILERLRRGERINRLQTVRTARDGTRISVSLTISPVRNGAGRAIGASTVARDVTAQRQAVQALQESEERFRAMVETNPECVSVVAADGTLLHMNSGGVRVLGGNCDEVVVGRCVYDLICAPDRDRFRAFNETVCAGEKGSLEFEVIGFDGRRRQMETHAAPMRNSDGTMVHLGVTRDVSARKQTEERERHLMAQSVAAAHTLDAQVRSRTREVEARNAEVLSQAAQLRELSWRLLRTQDDERRHIARELHDSAGQTLTVMGMDLAQLIDKAERLAPQLLPDAQVLEQSLRQLQREIRTTSYLLHPPLLDDIGLASALSWYVGGLAERTSLRIRLDIAEDFGRLPRDMELVVFRTVQECLTNIHRHSGSKTASIRIARQADRITVAVEDCGHGMSRETLQRLKSSGSGVGIAGMHERLRQFGGTLSIDSDRSGTQIRMKIPLPSGSSAGVDAPRPVPDPDVAPRRKPRARKARRRARPAG
jgi:PAS domain S-box-containing protein